MPPARLALATILQAYTGVSDDEVIEATVMDRRWQAGPGLHERGRAAIFEGDFGGVPQAADPQDPGPAPGRADGGTGRADRRVRRWALRAALDSSPLWGAGRVEDTFNLMDTPCARLWA